MEGYSLKTVNDLFETLYETNQRLKDDNQSIWWRGQGLLEWNLLPSVYRPEFLNHENCLTLDFIRKAKTRSQNIPSEGDYPGWLILMQHYGLPTRLLDWSESILVALYFVSNDHVNETGSLWAYNPYRFNYYENNTESILDPYSPLVSNFFAQPFTPVSCESKIVAINIPENDLRMLIQQAASTIHATKEPLNKIASDKCLCQYAISSELKKEIKIFLKNLGYNQSRIFPDLDHLAKELKEKYKNNAVFT